MELQKNKPDLRENKMGVMPVGKLLLNMAIPMIISILGVCGIRVGWVCTIFQIEAFHTPQSLYLSYPISWVIVFVCQMIAFRKVFRKQAGSDLGL